MKLSRGKKVLIGWVIWELLSAIVFGVNRLFGTPVRGIGSFVDDVALAICGALRHRRGDGAHFHFRLHVSVKAPSVTAADPARGAAAGLQLGTRAACNLGFDGARRDRRGR